MEKQQRAEGKENRPKAKPRQQKGSLGRMLLWFTGKWVFIAASLLFATIFGLVLGYSVIGNGNTADVFDMRTWKHVLDLVFKS